MDTLIYIAKAHLLFIVLGGIYHYTLRKERSFTFNRIYLLAIYGASTLAPLLEIKIFNKITFIEPELLTNNLITRSLNSASEAQVNSAMSLEVLIPTIYGILVSLSILTFLIKFIKSLYKFNLLYRFAQFDYYQNVYWTEDKVPPLTFLNKTLIPQSLKSDKHIRMIIKHEEAHRKTLHFLDIVWIELLSSILIFNPLNKRIKKYVVENHEFLADEYACSSSEKESYTQLLIQQTLNNNHFKFASYFAKPTILNRLNMLQNNQKSKAKPFFMGVSLLLISFMFSCDLGSEEIIVKSKDQIKSSDLSTNEIVDENTIFSIVEEQAEPQNGIQEFYNELSRDLVGKYPQEAINLGIEGAVYLQFVIERDGSLSNIRAVKGIGGGCDELAVELLQNQSNWIPGRHNGKVVRSQRVIPIRFVLK